MKILNGFILSKHDGAIQVKLRKKMPVVKNYTQMEVI
jgi:hypothetical protein